MHIVSINVGSPQTQMKGRAAEVTGIFKRPALERVKVAASGIIGDFIGNSEFHGGPDQAIYIYGSVDYDRWAGELRRDLEPGTFGENLTIEGLESAPIHIGDRLQMGGVTLEVTAPRHPCSTLARRMRDRRFVQLFRRAERPGLYARVIQEGELSGNETVHVEPCGGEQVTILELFRDHYASQPAADRVRRYLRAPLSHRLRAELESKLRALNS
jgi:MOSC domain-containing protein YiiM